MGIVLDRFHEEHKARQLRLRRAAFKEVTVEPKPQLEPEHPDPVPEIPQQQYCSTVFNATVREVCEFYNVRPRDAISNRHSPEFVKCRHIIAYILYDITSMTNPQIGRKMDRDPTSIFHAIAKIKKTLEELQPDITEIERRIALHKTKQEGNP